jgi:hypothetical protein
MTAGGRFPVRASHVRLGRALALLPGYHSASQSLAAAVMRDPPTWAATWIARVTVVTAPERLFGSRPGANKP